MNLFAINNSGVNLPFYSSNSYKNLMSMEPLSLTNNTNNQLNENSFNIFKNNRNTGKMENFLKNLSPFTNPFESFNKPYNFGFSTGFPSNIPTPTPGSEQQLMRIVGLVKGFPSFTDVLNIKNDLKNNDYFKDVSKLNKKWEKQQEKSIKEWEKRLKKMRKDDDFSLKFSKFKFNF